MSETTRIQDDPFEFEVVPAAGTVLSGIAMAGVLLPLRRGAADPVVSAAVVLALVSLAAFLARRHGTLSRATAAVVAAGGSLGVVVTSMYMLNRGITGTVPLSIGSLTISLVATAFAAAGLAIGLAVADYGELTGGDVLERATQTIGLMLVSLCAFVVAPLWLSLLFATGALVTGGLTAGQTAVIEQLAMPFAAATVAAGYVAVTDRDRSFVDVRRPTLRDGAWIVGGFVALLALAYLVQLVVTVTGAESTTHTSIERGQENPQLLLMLVPISILLIGPGEELLYRNIVQKSMYERFSRRGAIVVASVVFAAVHFSAYAAAGTSFGAVLVPLASVFGLSLVLGSIYERTENILVPALVHGFYNAFVFGSQYLAAI